MRSLHRFGVWGASALLVATGISAVTGPSYAAAKPDLIVGAVATPVAKANQGGALQVDVSVKNRGAATASRSVTKVWLSTNKSLSASDTLIGTRSVPMLAKGKTKQVVVSGKVPAGLAAGNYWVIACADATKRVPESNETNNCKRAATPVEVRTSGAPFALPDVVTTPEDIPEVVSHAYLLQNDFDLEDDELEVTNVFAPVEPGVMLDWSDGSLKLSTDPNVTGSFHISYIIQDSSGRTDQSVLTWVVENVNDAPEAVNDTAEVSEDNHLTLQASDLVGNDIDVDDDLLDVSQVFGSVNGNVSLVGDEVTFIPSANFAGQASFGYQVTDGSLTDEGTVTVTVLPVNDPPTAVNNLYTLQAGTSIDIPYASLSADDTDADGDPLKTCYVSGSGAGGAVVLIGGTTVRYTAPAVGVSSDYFWYCVTDKADGTALSPVVEGQAIFTITPASPCVISPLARRTTLSGAC